ncbi:SDR family NAD(P)-dependent oxidoreductase [Mucilaginibacter sp. Bleaf8]|uniref:SDR family NAD(P)-dependent oxidoreductase n=1 Tax=Mucilaginibacter sp. Bleaf8 TaxID=2834430 RepID=UPI001BD0D980|nr:SDR family NAD(P)-dependent oxidoreductase [Mucilaginibacter sp. Bleaf8]MBS7563401.1 SDR family NAD(P)-dependent oxidoreductase [Mucilaginibacter sp. Bleaf8]
MPFRTTVITGATSGIGKETALALAQKDHALYLLVRNTEKGEQLKKELVQQTGNRSIFVVHCDLADLQSVKDAADQLKGKLFAINTLINNAGGINAHRQESKDGIELTFAMNHVGHFLLTLSLMPLLEKGQARVINVSSEAHKMGKVLMLNDVQFKEYSAFGAYALAKLSNIWFAKSLAERFGPKGITAYALHPGVVKTGFGSELGGLGKVLMWLGKPFMITPQQGAQTSIYLASQVKISPKLNGQYFKKQQVAKTNLAAQNASARNKLWQISEQLIAPYL